MDGKYDTNKQFFFFNQSLKPKWRVSTWKMLLDKLVNICVGLDVARLAQGEVFQVKLCVLYGTLSQALNPWELV